MKGLPDLQMGHNLDRIRNRTDKTAGNVGYIRQQDMRDRHECRKCGIDRKSGYVGGIDSTAQDMRDRLDSRICGIDKTAGYAG